MRAFTLAKIERGANLLELAERAILAGPSGGSCEPPPRLTPLPHRAYDHRRFRIQRTRVTDVQALFPQERPDDPLTDGLEELPIVYPEPPEDDEGGEGDEPPPYDGGELEPGEH